MIELINVTKVYSEKPVVKNLSLKIEDGKITVLIGPSGCGKTTTLKMINRLVYMTEGDIRIDGKSILSFDPTELRRRIGYVIQEVGLFPHYTVFNNIAVVPKLLGWDRERIIRRVHELLELVNLPESYLNRYPIELSGGEKQRVGVARALSADPDILLMDEPFGAIDPINRRVLQDFFLDIQNELKKTVVFVTHDIREAIKMGDKIAIMKEGELVQFGDTKDILERPKNEFVENLLGSDRGIMKLSLLKVKDYANKNFKFIYESEIKDIESCGKEVCIVKNREGEILGYLDKGREGEILIRKFGCAYENDNLLEVMTVLLQDGKKIALVYGRDKKITGTVNLDFLINLLGEKR